MSLPRSLSPLKTPAFARFWLGAMVSHIGTAMEAIAVGILVTDTTGQASWTGIAVAAAFVPMGVMSLVGGSLADRVPRRRLLVTAIAFQILFAALLTYVAAVDAASPGVVTAIVFAGGIAAAATFPAYSSLLPDLVGIEEMPAAVALNATGPQVGRIVGPALAAIVIEVGGYTWAFALNALSFFAVLAAIAPMRLPPPEHQHGETLRASIARGVRFLRRDAALWTQFATVVSIGLLIGPIVALVPATAAKVFDRIDLGTWTLLTSFGLSAVTIGLTLGGITHRFGLRPVLRTSLCTLPILLGAYALAPTLWLAMLGIGLVGGAFMACQTCCFTVVQIRSPAELRGRVLSITQMGIFLTYSFGAIAQGWIADVVGLRATTLGAAVLLATAVIVIRARETSFDREYRHVEPRAARGTRTRGTSPR